MRLPCTALENVVSLATPEGTPLPGSSEVHSDGDLIELLKLYLETELGDDTFSQAYQFLKVHFLLHFRTRPPILTPAFAISATSSANVASNTCHCCINCSCVKTRSMQPKRPLLLLIGPN